MYEMKDFPPSIQELLKKKGWTWPPDEKLKKKMNEAAKRAAGSVHIEPDLLRDLLYDMGIDYGDEVWDKHKKKLKEKGIIDEDFLKVDGITVYTCLP